MFLFLEIQIRIVIKWSGNWFCLYAAKVTLNMKILCIAASCHTGNTIMLFCCHMPGDVFKVGVCIRVYWIWCCVPATVCWKSEQLASFLHILGVFWLTHRMIRHEVLNPQRFLILAEFNFFYCCWSGGSSSFRHLDNTWCYIDLNLIYVHSIDSS